jgi:hypothetical protein
LKIPNNTIGVLLLLFFNRYVEFVLAQAMSSNFLYSPLRKSFVSRISSGVKIERYASLSELIALCRLVGPNGLKYVEERLMRHAASVVGEIKVCSDNNNNKKRENNSPKNTLAQ